MSFLKKHGLLESTRVVYIKANYIIPNPGQPRKYFDSSGLQDLSESIQQYGVLQPLTVRKLDNGRFELIAGERRLRASKLAGLEEVPCIMLGADEKQSSLIALVENLQRCDLDFFEEAEGIKRLIYQFGLSQDEAAKRLGKSQSAVANKLRILRLDTAHINAIRENGLTERHARALLRLEDVQDRTAAIETIISRKLNVAQTDEYIDDYINSNKEVPQADKQIAEKPSSKKIKTLYVFKDARLFINTVTRALDTMKKSGLAADMQRQEEENTIILTIKIPKRVNVS